MIWDLISDALGALGTWLNANASTAVFTLLAVFVAAYAIKAETLRIQHAERQKVRESLRLWFDGISHNAKADLVDMHRAVDSQIKEDIRPLGRKEIRKLMEWALLIHDETWRQEESGATYESMHAKRMYAKWLFRDIAAEWALRPLRTRRRIRRITKKGYGALDQFSFGDAEAKRVTAAYRPFDPEAESREPLRPLEERHNGSVHTCKLRAGWKKKRAGHGHS
jgi:hypothetical protein